GHGQSDEGSHRAVQGARGWEETARIGCAVAGFLGCSATQQPSDATTMLTESERQRYARHLTLPEFGEEGQQKLKNGSALIVGAGGLGSPVAMYLAAAGVGRIGIVDFDRVDFSNLQRQIIPGTAHGGRPK